MALAHCVKLLGSIVSWRRCIALASTLQTDSAVCHTSDAARVRFFTLDSFGMNSDCHERPQLRQGIPGRGKIIFHFMQLKMKNEIQSAFGVNASRGPRN